MFQNKSYLRAVLVAVCIPLLCDNAFRYSDKSGSSTCRSRSWCHRCCPQFEENKIEITIREIKEESEIITARMALFRCFGMILEQFESQRTISIDVAFRIEFN